MKHTFGLGMIAGVSTLAIAVPLLAQIAGAASSTSSASTTVGTEPARTPPSQACVQAMAVQEGNTLSGLDALMAAHKAALLAHKDALTAAALIADDTQREAAIQKANQDRRTAMQAAMTAQAPTQAQQDALKAACGNSFGGRGFGGMMMGEMGMGGHGHGGPGFFGKKHAKPAGAPDTETNDDAAGQTSSTSSTAQQ